MRIARYWALVAGGLMVVLAGCSGQSGADQVDVSLPAPSVSAPEANPVTPQNQSVPPADVEAAVPDTPVADDAVQPEAAVPLCAYYEPSGTVVSAPCDQALIDPARQLVPVQQSAPSQESVTAITCDTVCTSSGCEQYQYSVLNCP